jgi:hypothetical protein
VLLGAVDVLEAEQRGVDAASNHCPEIPALSRSKNTSEMTSLLTMKPSGSVSAYARRPCAVPARAAAGRRRS